jgi:hypothetical protein
MRPWPEQHRQVLRHLAAARYYLPVELKPGQIPDSEAQYQQYLHHTEFDLALEELEALGDENTGHAEEELFWSELALAAECMDLAEHSARYRKKIRDLPK